MRTVTYTCPQCQTERDFETGPALELLPAVYWDETSIVFIECTICHLKALSFYDEERHGSLDSEGWEVECYQLPEPQYLDLKSLMAQCPNQNSMNKGKERACRCFAHLALGEGGKNYRHEVPFHQERGVAKSFVPSQIPR